MGSTTSTSSQLPYSSFAAADIDNFINYLKANPTDNNNVSSDQPQSDLDYYATMQMLILSDKTYAQGTFKADHGRV